VRARARIVAAADGRGGTRLVELYGEAPLLPRQTGPRQTGAGEIRAGEIGAREVHLVGGAAGPLGGDELRIEIEVQDGAELTVRTVAATLALPGRGPSTLELIVRVGEHASLRWLPEPLVAVAGCDHRTVSTVDISRTARLQWREELVLGRHGEAPGDLRASLRVRRDAVPLLAQELAVGPHAVGFDGAAVLGGARAVGTVLVVDPAWLDRVPPGRTVEDGALVGLAGPAMLATAVAPDAHTLRTRLTTLLSVEATTCP
jgi:urease accessory protein